MKQPPKPPVSAGTRWPFCVCFGFFAVGSIVIGVTFSSRVSDAIGLSECNPADCGRNNIFGSCPACPAEQQNSSLARILNAMQLMNNPGGSEDGKYSPGRLNRMITCMDQLDPSLPGHVGLRESMDNAWNSIIQYSKTNGTVINVAAQNQFVPKANMIKSIAAGGHGNGLYNDFWGGCNGAPNRSCDNWIYPPPPAQWETPNKTMLHVKNEKEPIAIYQPCNFASNVAYMQAASGMCDRKSISGSTSIFNQDTAKATSQGLATLFMGSAFYHGSQTLLGNLLDSQAIDLLAFTIHQSTMAHLLDVVEGVDVHKPGFSRTISSEQRAIVKDLYHLNFTANYSKIRSDLVASAGTSALGTVLNATSTGSSNVNNGIGIDGQAATQAYVNVYSSMPVDKWWYHMNALFDDGVPDYHMSFSAVIGTYLTLLLPDPTVTTIVKYLTKAFSIDLENREFLKDGYLVQLRATLAKGKVKLAWYQKLDVGLKGLGTIVKLLYAFLWQEHTFKLPSASNNWLHLHDVNQLGADMMSSLNQVANMLTGYRMFHYTDKDFMPRHGVYPGDTQCRVWPPHSKWHEQSANGLFDLGLLSGSIHDAIATALGGSDTSIFSTSDISKDWVGFWKAFEPDDWGSDL